MRPVRLLVLAILLVLGLAAPAAADGSHSHYRVTASVSPTEATLGSVVTVRGRVSPHAAGRQVTLQLWTGTTWAPVATARLGRSSRYAVTTRPGDTGTARYRVVIARHGTHRAGRSAPVLVDVTPVHAPPLPTPA